MKKFLIIMACFAITNAKAQTTTISLTGNVVYTTNLVITQPTIIDGNGFNISFAPNTTCVVKDGGILLVKNAILNQPEMKKCFSVVGCGIFEYYNFANSEGSMKISGISCNTMGSETYYLDGTLK